MFDEDLKNTNIEMNPPNNTGKNSISSSPQEGEAPSATKKFINGFKNFIQSKITSTNIEKDNIDNIDINSENSGDSRLTTDENKPETCKDKIAKKIIEKFEVERNYKVFAALMAIGSILICFSFFLIPLIITSPAKFSFAFAVGSVFMLLSFLFYHGTKVFVTKIFESKRLCVSIVFLLSIFLGIGFSLGSHYILSLLCSLVQLLSMIMFFLSFLPGGTSAVAFIKRKLSSPFTKVFMAAAESKINNM